MKVASNKINDIRAFIKRRLHGLYPDEEINSFIFLLFEAFCGLSKTELLVMKRECINESELLLVYDAVKELEHYRPIQHIIGSANFYDLKFKVNADVLIPRPETEELVRLIIEENKNKSGVKLLDVGTGSGCIAVTLKKYLPAIEVFATDNSKSALAVAKENALMNSSDVTFFLSDILIEDSWQQLPDFDILVSNPPYVTESEKAAMMQNVLQYEPAAALYVPDANPLLYYSFIFRLVKARKKKILVYAEINESKAADLRVMAETAGLSEISILKDINGKDRFIKACARCL